MKNYQTVESRESRVESQPDTARFACPRRSTLVPRRAFTLIELLVVIAIMGVLAGMLLAVVGGVKKKQYVWHAQAEMALLTTAIERYKAAYGFYPPSPNTIPKIGAAATYLSPLYYELEGTTTTNGSSYTTLDGRSTVFQSDLQNTYPGLGGFMNCTRPGAGEDALKARSFLPDLRPKQTVLMTNNLTGINGVVVLLCAVGGPDATYQPMGAPDINPWRYNSTNPTNNPGSYDLWVQLVFGGKTNLVCNWSKQVQINNPLP